MTAKAFSRLLVRSRVNPMRLTACLLAAAAGAVVFLWLGRLSAGISSPLTTEYTRALAAGHPYLGVKPDPRLLALPNPYDPQANRALRLLDASLYHGRYYLYYGVTPFLTILVPWFLATGRILGENEVIAGYGIGILACLGLILFDASRRYFRRAGPAAAAVALLAAALAGGELLLLRRPLIYELVIASACFHDCAALLAAYLALHDRKRSGLWLALAGANAGLAVAARPSHVGVAAVVALFVFRQVRGERDPGRRRWGRLALILAPLAAIAVAVGWFNAVRFGSPLDFGYRYLLVDVGNFGSTFASLRYLPYNLWQYLVGWPRWSGWFPFIEGPAASPFALPRGYYSMDQVYGLLVTAPFALCSLALPARWRSLPATLRTFVLLALALGAVNLAFLAVIDGAVYRYTADFLPYLLLTGGFGLLALSAEAEPGARAKSWAGTFLAVVSLLASFCAAFALYDMTRVANPDAFERSARVFNEPRLLAEGLWGRPLGGLAIRTRLPRDKFGRVEPLLVTGRPSLQDFLYLYYAGPGVLQVGFESSGRGGPLSAPLAVDYDQPVRFELTLGHRWPPAGARPYAGLSTAEVAALRRTLVVKVNGRTALDCPVDYHPTKELYSWGASPDDAAFGSLYSGSRLEVSSVDLPPFGEQEDGKPENYGALRLEIKRAANPAQGVEPIVTIGYRASWQGLGMVDAGQGRVRFVVRGSDGPGERSSPHLEMPEGTVHQLTFAAGGLLPPLASGLWQSTPMEDRRKDRGRVRLVFDGAVILEATAPAPEVGPAAVEIGANPARLGGTAPVFSGEITVRGRNDFIH